LNFGTKGPAGPLSEGALTFPAATADDVLEAAAAKEDALAANHSKEEHDMTYPMYIASSSLYERSGGIVPPRTVRIQSGKLRRAILLSAIMTKSLAWMRGTKMPGLWMVEMTFSEAPNVLLGGSLGRKDGVVDLNDGEHKGAKMTLRCDIWKLAPNLDSLESNKNEELLSGFITILVTHAENLSVENEDASSFVKVKYGSETEFVTPTVTDSPGIDALNPIFDSVFHIPLTPKLMDNKDVIEFVLINGVDSILGTAMVTHDNLVEAAKSTITENGKIGDKGASLKFRVLLQGVEQPSGSSVPSRTTDSLPDKPTATTMSSSVTHSNTLGTVRLTAAKGWGFVPEKRRLHRKDIPDIYCAITFGSSPNIWRTSIVKNSVTPEWNEFSDYLLSNHGQMITITVFDEDKGHDKDDELGGARITVGKLLLAGGLMDVELLQDGKPTGMYVSLGCEMI